MSHASRFSDIMSDMGEARAGAPDRELALRLYASGATRYDARTRALRPIRRAAVKRLDLAPGETVVDVGCGTGVNLADLVAQVTEAGRVIGIELSPEMAAAARARASEAGWANVEILQCAAEDAVIDEPAEAALFSFTHDILRSPAAVGRIRRLLRPGAAVCAAGVKRSPVPGLDRISRRASRGFVTTFDGWDAPYDVLLDGLEDIRVSSRWLGAIYVASGTILRPVGSG